MTWHENQSAATAITFAEWNNMVTWAEKNSLTHPSGATGDYVLSQTTAAVILDSTNHVVLCDTTGNAIAITLPAASSNIGQRYIVVFETDGGTDVTVVCAGADTYIGAGTPAGGTTATLVDADDYFEIVAIASATTNYWLVVGIGGTNAGIL